MTNQPFGATEQRVSHKGHQDGPSKQQHAPDLQEVEPFDLNAPHDASTGKKKKAPATPETFLGKNKAPKDAPQSSSNSILTGDLADKSMLKSPEDHDIAPGKDEEAGRKSSIKEADDERPPNPMEAKAGEKAGLPLRNNRLSMVQRDANNQVDLPKVPKGQGEGPPVLYGKDIILDMGGYHKDHKSTDSSAKATEGPTSISADPTSPPTPAPLDPHAPPPNAKTIKDEHVEEFVNDLMASSSSAPRPGSDIASAMGGMSLDDTDSRPSSPTARRHFDRAKSEPPGADSRPSSPNGDRLQDSQMDLAWDWAGPAEEEGKRPLPHRAGSMPIEDPGLQTLRAKLTAIDDDPYTFMLQLDDRVHLFELSLCGSDDFASEAKANVS